MVTRQSRVASATQHNACYYLASSVSDVDEQLIDQVEFPAQIGQGIAAGNDSPTEDADQRPELPCKHLSESFAVGCGRETPTAYRTGLSIPLGAVSLHRRALLAEVTGIPVTSAFSFPGPHTPVVGCVSRSAELCALGTYSPQHFACRDCAASIGKKKPQVGGNQPGVLVDAVTAHRRYATSVSSFNEFRSVAKAVGPERYECVTSRHVICRWNLVARRQRLNTGL